MATDEIKRKTGKGTRDPQKTREAIMEVTGKLLARDGPEGLSVSQVAQLAGVNRGTAYHHFPTREQLIDETIAWVSNTLRLEVFGDEPEDGSLEPRNKPREIIEKLASFAMENPELGRVWLRELLSNSQPASDPFWNMYKGHVDRFVESEFSQPGIDSEVHAITLIVTVFLWPVWARAHTQSAAGRKRMASRFTDEMLRLSLHGTLNKEKFQALDVSSDSVPDAVIDE
ncbi:TetR/AcrR family transcriptional regulator [Zhongshania aquimaris]|uniref:TetR/AcrR family transcriptional regulator n=1 Tax=Zhongshania aquimaris TaxID=2857107 RepID=A0ABS6VWR2_9GAMM|nr:TetR/AcrR family transcriptional regulator [Zhongshania aquimaris]MBW2942770.1 TetR/AcrR family transcriptional regulator [Zhongshania aquimaris]